LRCFFFDIRLRRFLMTEPMRRPFLIVVRLSGRRGAVERPDRTRRDVARVAGR
jgi:hypothetical protein